MSLITTKSQSLDESAHMVNHHDLERMAKQILSKEVYAFIDGGAQDEITLKINREAFENLQFIPRVLTGGFNIDLTTKLLSHTLAMPVLIAPMGLHELVHPEGEKAVARASIKHNIMNISSLMASQPFGEVASLGGMNWFQLYLLKDKGLTLELIQMAEHQGASALVLTVDMPVMGTREQSLRYPLHLSKTVKAANIAKLCGVETISAFTNSCLQNHMSWSDITWLKSKTKLPIVLKGILHHEDVLLAQTYGINAVILSNHGGRQLDYAISSVDALRRIKQPQDITLPLIVDGGIRRGGDIVKALMLGASAVTIGRPLLWGLAVNGESGVIRVINKLKSELEETMILLGCHNVQMLRASNSHALVHKLKS